MTNKSRGVLLAVVLLSGWACAGGVAAETRAPRKEARRTAATRVERGRYLSKIGGCNDCHTPGYLLSEGKVPEKMWLTGDTFGWRGPWGTTYAINLRLYMSALSEDQWLASAKTIKARPPMPWFDLNIMHGGDLRAIHRYVRHLGPGGELAPAYVPPDQEPKAPYALFPSPPK